ncbi:predicted protein [Sclerotinia sclerotiorum 1980 UF-70]|uniref:Uncharacterized protein n=1 Tax=Sclerotinia sclerotiorum (strain ATCC 18683 / 1980 / Ss-1) TaxID=665079 RepID=A7ELB4_SCLS1|nr:predicted protein [Sclerotinia sclerotiorum 1980 UF-70]EDO03630.1 predicted protein [Sclerotinia sclerotiorum 1980 UF-70]
MANEILGEREAMCLKIRMSISIEYNETFVFDIFSELFIGEGAQELEHCETVLCARPQMASEILSDRRAVWKSAS